MPNEGSPSHIPLGPGKEFDLVRAMLAIWGDLAHGIGDDAAVLTVSAGQQLVVSTDTSVENVHFRRPWITPIEVGYRATQAALSDLAAMAARPLGILIALSVPPDWVDAVPDLARGIGEAAREARSPIRGGDLTSGQELALNVTVLGASAAPIGRAGVRPGDVLCVTGVLGGPTRALRSWGEGAEPAPWCRQRFARPRARLSESVWLAERGAHAMIDISDGLASELRHLAHASGVEIRVEVDRVPCGDGGTWRDAMTGGEEYELVVALPHEVDADTFARTFGIPLTRIGRARAAERASVTAILEGERVDLTWGHDHFST